MEIPTINIEDDTHIYYDSGKIYSKRYNRFVGSNNGNGYLKVKINGEDNYIHRVIYTKFIGEIPEGYDIDHLNHVRYDNRVINLHTKTKEQNNQRKLITKRNTSGFIGVDYCKRDNYWRARIYYKGKCIFYQSGFKTAEEANVARNKFLDDNPELCEFYPRN